MKKDTCVCGYEGDDFIYVETEYGFLIRSEPQFWYADKVVKVVACPKCGTLKVLL